MEDLCRTTFQYTVYVVLTKNQSWISVLSLNVYCELCWCHICGCNEAAGIVSEGVHRAHPPLTKTKLCWALLIKSFYAGLQVGHSGLYLSPCFSPPHLASVNPSQRELSMEEVHSSLRLACSWLSEMVHLIWFTSGW